MSDSAQEKATEDQGIAPVPGHQGGPPPRAGAEEADGDRANEADSGHPDHIEPRAGLDE
jgi:hypothetical protein